MTLEEKFWQLWMVPGDLESGTTVYEHGVFGLQVRERGDWHVETIPPPRGAWPRS